MTSPIPQRMKRRERIDVDQRNRYAAWFEDVTSLGRRVLTTVLFTDIVGSTDKVIELGDRVWSQLVERHQTRFREQLGRFGGREVDVAGDGFLAAFGTATLGIACAFTVRDRARELGLELRTGLHTGECEVDGDRIRGIAVHTGARVAALASPGEVLVSSTVRDVVAGSGIRFEDRGFHELRGISGESRLFAALGTDGSPACSTRPGRMRRRAAGVSRSASRRVTMPG
jgi:class 3 adenylate cyclase